MRATSRWLYAALAACALLTGCGQIGEILPPALDIPVRTSDLSAIEQGSKIVVEFTIPALTTENLTLKRVKDVELRAGISGEAKFDFSQWLAASKRLDVVAEKPGRVRVEIPAAPWAGKSLYFVVRSVGPKGRGSAWSNLFLLPVVAPLSPPSGLAAEATAEGVRVHWNYAALPSLSFRVYRRTGTEEKPQVVQPTVNGEAWTDPNTEYKKQYSYWVQAVQKAGESEAESPMTGPISITPEDRFPPAVPAGLTAIAGINSIELTWDRNIEPDFAFYRLYRSADGSPFKLLAGNIPGPSYSDHAIEAGKRYQYRVAAVDSAGNESQPSQPIEVAATK